MNSRIFVIFLLAAFHSSHAWAADTNLTVEPGAGGLAPLVVWRGNDTNQYFEVDPRGVPAYSPSNPVRDTDLVGLGPWSKPVTDGHGNTLRGRLLLYRGTKSTNPPVGHVVWNDAPAYVEIQDLTEANPHPTRIYFDLSEHLPFDLRDAQGREPDPLRRPGLRGGRAPSFWVTLPARGRLRLRADAVKGGIEGNDGELRLLFFSMSWLIPAGDTNQWLLSATLLPPPPPDKAAPYSPNVWQGVLKFPAVKFSAVNAKSKVDLPSNSTR